MARIAPLIERLPGDRRESQKAWHDQGCVCSPQRRCALGMGDALLERILRRINTTSQEEVLKKIAPLTGIRRHKVLEIRRRIAEGTYDLADRLDGVVEQVLEVTRSTWECQPPDAQRRCGQGVETCVARLCYLAPDRCASRR